MDENNLQNNNLFCTEKIKEYTDRYEAYFTFPASNRDEIMASFSNNKLFINWEPVESKKSKASFFRKSFYFPNADKNGIKAVYGETDLLVTILKKDENGIQKFF